MTERQKTLQGHHHHSTPYSQSTGADGSTNFKTLYDEIEQATGFSMRKELNALITEVYLSGNFGSQTDKSAALSVGMQKISKYLYDVTMTELIASDDDALHELGLHAMTVSFHKPHMHGGRGHSGTQDRGSHELMHVLNPRKDSANVREYFFDDNKLGTAEGAELREIFKTGITLADMFGKNGGNSADGWLGQSMHPSGLRDLAEWSGVDLPRYADAWSHRVSVQFVNFDSNNTDGIFLGMGKKGNGGSDKSHGTGRDKFEQTFDFDTVADKLNFTAGEASGTAQNAVIDAPPPAHDHGNHGDGHDMPVPSAADDSAQTAQNQTIVVDVLGNDDADGGKLTLTDVSYDGNSSLVSIQNNMIKVNPLNAHRDDRTEMITYTATDENGATTSAVLEVDIGKGAAAITPVTTPKAPDPVQDPDLLEFFFVNTATDKVIGKLEDGAKVAAEDLQGPVSIFANDVDDGVDIGAVRLAYGGHTQFEGVEPYALFGNRGGDYQGGTSFGRGSHDVEIDVLDANHQQIESFSVMFDVV